MFASDADPDVCHGDRGEAAVLAKEVSRSGSAANCERKKADDRLPRVSHIVEMQGGDSMVFFWNEFWNEFWNKNWNETLFFFTTNPNAKIGMIWSPYIYPFKK